MIAQTGHKNCFVKSTALVLTLMIMISENVQPHLCCSLDVGEGAGTQPSQIV